jgi:CRP/FNR family transcriptional regulator, cyclic AMP receptor protein
VSTILEPALRDLFLLHGADDDVCAELAAMSVCRTYPRGNLLFYHGEPADSVFLLLSGQVKISQMNDEGREVSLALVRAPGIVGIVAALDDGGHIGTGTTVTQCRLSRIPRDRFIAFLQAHASLYPALTHELAHHLRHAYAKIGEQALLSVKRRLLSALIEIARSEGRPDDGDRELVFVRPTHQELAERVGSSRVVVTRLLRELLEEEDGLAAEGRVMRVALHSVELHDEFGS